VLAAGALGAARVLARAGARYRLLAGAFVIVAVLGPAALAVSALRPAADGAGPTGPLEPFAVPVLGLVTAFACALLFELIVDVERLRRIKRAARPLGTAAVRNATIGVSAIVPTPTAIGYLHPAIVLPADFRGRVDAAEWEAVVAHECAHLARRDDWAKAIQSAVMRAGWWLPGLWLLGRGLDLERELASDERASGATGARRYAACLLRLASGGCAEAVAPALWGRRSHVAIRVERLLRPVADPSPALRSAILGAFTATALAVVCFAVAAVPAIGRHAGPAVHPPRLALDDAARVSYRGRADAEPVAVAARAAPSAPEPPAAAAAPPAAPKPVATALRTRAARPAEPATVAHRSALEALHGTVVAYLPAFRCPTCFRPLHAMDGGIAGPAQPVPASAAPVTFAPAATVAAEDTGSGPASASAGFLWLRMPRVLILP
jgi:Zn-dependent protease with chaperone function